MRERRAQSSAGEARAGGRHGLRDRAVRWLGARLPPCDAVSALASESLDRALSARERLQVRLHVAICELCGRYAEQVKLMRAAVRARAAATGDSPSSPRLSEGARERLARAVAARAARTDDHQPPRGSGGPGRGPGAAGRRAGEGGP